MCGKPMGGRGLQLLISIKVTESVFREPSVMVKNGANVKLVNQPLIGRSAQTGKHVKHPGLRSCAVGAV